MLLGKTKKLLNLYCVVEIELIIHGTPRKNSVKFYFVKKHIGVSTFFLMPIVYYNKLT
jgi:hypothetical protein